MFKFKENDSHVKWLIFNAFIYGLMIVATTVYVYARLDYVRSGAQNKEQTAVSNNQM